MARGTRVAGSPGSVTRTRLLASIYGDSEAERRTHPDLCVDSRSAMAASRATACILTRNRIGPAIILQPLHFSVLVRHGFLLGLSLLGLAGERTNESFTTPDQIWQVRQ